MVYTVNVVWHRALLPGEEFLRVDRRRLAFGDSVPRWAVPHAGTVARFKRRYLNWTAQERLDFILHYISYWPLLVVRVMQALQTEVTVANRECGRHRRIRQVLRHR